MSDSACRSCGAPRDTEARFCPQCGARVSGRLGVAPQLLAAGVLLIELLAMGVMSQFAAPRLRDALQDFGAPQMGVLQLLLHPAWLPSFMVGVAVLGGLAVFKRMTTLQRVMLVSVALVLGLVPMLGTVGAIYLLPLQIAAGLGGP